MPPEPHNPRRALSPPVVKALALFNYNMIQVSDAQGWFERHKRFFTTMQYRMGKADEEFLYDTLQKRPFKRFGKDPNINGTGYAHIIILSIIRILKQAFP